MSFVARVMRDAAENFSISAGENALVELVAKVARDRGRGLRRVERREDGADCREQRVGEHGEALGEEIGCLDVVQVQAGSAVGILHVFDGAALDDGIALIAEGIDELRAHLREAARLHRDGMPGLGR